MSSSNDPSFPERGPAPERADGGARDPGLPEQPKPRVEALDGDQGSLAGHGRAAGASRIGVLGDEPPEAAYATREPLASPHADRRAGRSGTRTILTALGLLAALVGAFVYFGSSEGDPDPAVVEYADDAQEAVAVDDAQILEASEAQTDRLETSPVVDTNDTQSIAEPDVAPVPRPAEAPRPAAEPPAEQIDDGEGNSGAVATVSAFYAALGRGDGGSAARLVIPSKRASGPLSAGALTRYYSSFRRPLRLRDATAIDGDTVRVTYDYVLPDGRTCQGRASVEVVGSGEETLVRSIRTQGPC